MASHPSVAPDVTSPAAKRLVAPSNLFFALWLTFLSVLAGFAAYYRIFTGFAPWDDEGSMMVTVRQFMAGTKLYNDIPVPYGPVYYFYNWALRTVSGTPVTHDAVRMSSLLPWLLTAFLSAWIVFRITSSVALASAAHVSAFRLLWDCFHNEPGHPQELCILLLVALGAAGVVASMPQRRTLGLVLLGSLVAALILVKVNIGVFALLATSLAILAHSPKTRLSQLAFYANAAACLLLPIVLMKTHFRDWSTQSFTLLVDTSMLAVLVVLIRVRRESYFSFRGSYIAIGAFLTAFLVPIAILKAQGVSLIRTVHALLLDSLGPFVVRSLWYLPLPSLVRHEWLLWLVFALVSAWYLSGSANLQHTKSYISALKLFLVALTTVGVLFGLPYFGDVPPLFFFVPPLCWLVLFGNSGSEHRPYSFARTLFCVLAVLQLLYAYPIAGTQFEFVQVLPAVLVIICLGDFLAEQRERLGKLSPIVLRTASALALLGFAGWYLAIAHSARTVYSSLPSLQLPGSARIHLAEAQAQDYGWLVRQLNNHCDLFVGVPEVPSLHVWTGSDPLNGMDMGDWMIGMPDRQQLAASAILSQHPNACAVYNQELVDFWDHPHHDLTTLPLVRYLSQNFKVAGATGHFLILIQDERDLSPGPWR